MGFGTLALIAVIALAGPALAWNARWNIPVVIGELAAGICFGATGLNQLHASNSTFSFMADIGFALVMFVAGSHVPIRDPALRTGAAHGAGRAIAVGLLATVLAVVVAEVFHTGHPALYAVLMASSSAALVLPIMDSDKIAGQSALELIPQVALADVACIVALPLAIAPQHALRAALGALATIASGLIAFLLLSKLDSSGQRRRLRRVSRDRAFALELRTDLAVLFGLAALAVHTHVSIMLAGFALGVAVTTVGEPRRLARQIFGITEGFLGPLFYVWLGASLNLRDLGRHPNLIGLGFALGAGAVLSHLVGRLLGQPIAFGALAAAQLGVPVAAATLGTQSKLLEPGEAPALLLGALVTIGLATAAAAMVASRPGAPAE